MKSLLMLEEKFAVGKPAVFDTKSPMNSFAVFFEDDGDTGYFYALDTEKEPAILDAVHIYSVVNVIDRDIPSKLQIAWSDDGLKSALIINDFVHAVFDFAAHRGYCRTGFPPDTDWSKEGHEWSYQALDLF